MRLSWNEIRTRAAAFSNEWRDAAYEKGETQSFYNDFFKVFGVKRRSVARYEEHVEKIDNRSGYIDLFWPGQLLVEQKSAGRDLAKAYGQAGEYFDALPERDRPRYILVSDFRTFELYDRDEREKVSFSLADLPRHVEKFGFIIGVQRRKFQDQDPANVRAAELVGRLHDALEAVGYQGHDLECFLVRIAFCLFADDTGIFEPRDIFFDFLESRTREDGSDLGLWLSQLFQVLNTPVESRQSTLDEDLVNFPYVNGRLFDGPLRIPAFDSLMREMLLDACRFDWSSISPAIFGALFQSVMDPVERRAKGAHYTTEKNILKVTEPLFMDDLRAEFERLRSRKDSRRRNDLVQFKNKLGELKFFDPACGCGNFLVIAYRELRLLEIDVLRELGTRDELDVTTLSEIDVDQFYGIEIGEFPARIAETAMWMMDHVMNNRLSLEFGKTFTHIPLKKSPHIVHCDALETDWSELLMPAECSFVFGNPPFVGAKYQTEEQRAQVRRIADLGKSGGTLDYVAAWFIKAGEYVKQSEARIGFVATNSLTQGEQVAQLWPILFERCELEIAFAISVRRRRAFQSAFSGAGRKLSDQRDGQIDYRLQAHRWRKLYFKCQATCRLPRRRAGSAALCPPIHRSAGIPARRGAVHTRAARRFAGRSCENAQGSGAGGCRLRFSTGQQKPADTETCRDAHAVPRQRCSRETVSGNPRSKFGAAGVCAYWLAGASRNSEQPCENT